MKPSRDYRYYANVLLWMSASIAVSIVYILTRPITSNDMIGVATSAVILMLAFGVMFGNAVACWKYGKEVCECRRR